MTKDEILRFVDYDPITGIFRWKVKRKRGNPGEFAGSIDSEGYRVIGICGKSYKAHRLAFFIMNGYLPRIVDHKDLDRDNNRSSNLRDASASESQCNRGRPKNNKSGVKGVHFNKQMNKWVARVTVNRIQYHLGYFTSLKNAISARESAANNLHGEFCHND